MRLKLIPLFFPWKFIRSAAPPMSEFLESFCLQSEKEVSSKVYFFEHFHLLLYFVKKDRSISKFRRIRQKDSKCPKKANFVCALEILPTKLHENTLWYNCEKSFNS